MESNKVINAKQLSAITTNSQYVRVIAGAGSGKTFVLTNRIIFLLNNLHVNSQEILVLTFTNKACKEIRKRVENETHKEVKIFTFHSFCSYFLSYEINNIGMGNNFTILDQEDKKKLLKDIKKKIYGDNLDYANIEKNILKESYFFEKHGDNYKYQKITEEYEKLKRAKNALDFDDLILKTIDIMENYPDVKQKWVQKFKYILVDEFQDTDIFQFRLIKSFCNNSTSLYVVGDPDQTIYEWRGAEQEIILGLDKLFKNIETIILDQNYRSSKSILKAANNLIKHNTKRIAKDMFTEKKDTEKIDLRIFKTRQQEADYIARKINFLKETQKIRNFNEVVILFRSVKNVFPYEKALSKQNIPYVIIGGQSFFKKKEIKNIVSYIRLISDNNDDLAFEYIINTPKRKIGDKTLQNLKNECEKYNETFFSYIKNIKRYKTTISKQIIQKLAFLVEEIEKVKIEIEKAEIDELPRIINFFLQSIGYLEYVQTLTNKTTVLKDLFFLLNIDMLDFLKKNNSKNLSMWIRDNILIFSQDELGDNNECVSIMTIHATKGLEFDCVFIADMSQTVYANINNEEERRTYYVAFTRAKKKLFLSRNVEFNFDELPYIEESGLKMPELVKKNIKENLYKNNDFFVEKSHFNQQYCNNLFKKNDIVIHSIFGTGVIKEIIDQNFVQVFFDKCGKNGITLVLENGAIRKK
ncbi:MAG: UvrD-helicase domain-containing protein [Bacilli bacterium]|nr:UvrD-helicase domain-containing protein [Bacilli bacterium]